MYSYITLLVAVDIFTALFSAGFRKSHNRPAPHVLHTHDALYLHATSRSASTRNFPRVIQFRNGSVSRRHPRWLTDRGRYRYQKLTLIGIQNQPKLTCRECFACHPRYCNLLVFLAIVNRKRATRWTVIISSKID